jgi:Polyketide cyclase / dehydrase and lipid transport
MAQYSFLTTWILDAPRDLVWDAIYEVERWPEWWHGVRQVEKLEDGIDDDGVGALYRHEWRSVIPYPVRFETRITRIEEPHVIEADADGELAGTGRWRFFSGRETAVTYEWDVRTTRAWMNVAAPVARPIFRWNHNVVMHQGGVGLAALLGTQLLAVT